MIWIFLLLIIAASVVIILTYNKLIKQIKEVEEAKSELNSQLDQRFKIFEGLIVSVHKVMNFEHTILKDLVQFRSQAQSARSKGDTKGQFAAEDRISKITSQIKIVFAEYPKLDLIAKNQELLEEIAQKETELQSFKSQYNQSIRGYNNLKDNPVGNIVVSYLCKNLDKKFDMWKSNDK